MRASGDPQAVLIADLSAVLAETDRLLITAICERDAYRLLAQQAIHQLANLTRDHDRLRDRQHQLLEELRALRAYRRDRERAA